MLVVFLFCLMAGLYAEPVELGKKCWGTYNYAATTISSLHYWSCARKGTLAVLKTCEEKQIYDKKSGLCVAGEVLPDGRLVKRGNTGGKDLKVIEREALGETVTVGTMYDARKSLVQNGLSFWKPEKLATEVDEMSTVYSNVEVFMENSINERSYTMGVDASLKLEFLGGLISVGGSAHYLRDESSSTDVARVTMNYHATTKTKTLPINTVKDFPGICSKINKDTGPTHVVTSVTYGLRSYLLYEKDVLSTEYREEVGGSLSIAVNTVPSFKIEGQAGVNVDGDFYKNVDKLRVKFYGDAIISEMPSHYNQTIKVFDEVNKAARTNDTPIKYQLTPIGYFCGGTEAIVNDISEYLTNKVTGVLTELADVQRQVKTLLGKDPAIRFTSIKSQLLTFKAGLEQFITEITGEVATLLPELKSGEATEVELEELFGKYMESKWNKDKADVFLDHRARELRTIELVTEEANSLSEVSLSDIGGATDNKCIFNQKYATVYQLYVLPAKNVAKMYKNGEYTKDTEKNQWYNDLYRVGQAGADLKDFLVHAKLNAGDDHCFLIRLDNITNNENTEKDAVIRLYKNGKLLEGDFKPPAAGPAPTCAKSLYSGFDLVATRNTDPKSHVTAIKIEAAWKKEKEQTEEEKKEKKKVEYEYFPTTAIVANTEKISIGNLKPSTEYEVKIYYRVGREMGYSPSSAVITCKTASTTAPILPQVTDDTDVEYRVVLKTGDVSYASTNDWVYMTISGTKGRTAEVGLNDPHIDDMIRGKTDTHVFMVQDIGDINCVKFRIDGTDGWHAEQVEIYKNNKLSFDSGQLGVWLDDNETKEFCGTDAASDIQRTKPGAIASPDATHKINYRYLGALTKSRVSLQWSKPQKSTVSSAYIKYVVTASVNGEAKRQIETSDLTATLDELERGTLYDFTIQPFVNGVGSETVGTSFATIPYPPDVPLLESVTTNSMELIVFLSRMVLPAGITKDSLIVRYYKMDSKGSKALYGTDKTITVAVSGQNSNQVVTIVGLDAGSKYGVSCKLRVRAAGKLFETAESEALIAATVLPQGDFNTVEQDVTNYASQTTTRIDALTTKITRVANSVTTFDNNFNSKQAALDSKMKEVTDPADLKMSASEKLIAGTTRNNCVRRGIRYTGTTLGTKTSDVRSSYECLKKCKESWSATMSVTYSIAPSPNAGTCTCLKERRGSYITNNGFYNSISRLCYEIGAANTAKYGSCVKVNTNYDGADIGMSRGVGSIRECAILCSETDACKSITYHRPGGNCWLKNKDEGDQTYQLNDYDSLTLSCLS